MFDASYSEQLSAIGYIVLDQVFVMFGFDITLEQLSKIQLEQHKHSKWFPDITTVYLSHSLVCNVCNAHIVSAFSVFFINFCSKIISLKFMSMHSSLRKYSY